MELLTLTGTGGYAECSEWSHGSRPLPHDLEQAGEVFRHFRIDRNSRPLVLPEIEVAASQTFERRWIGFR
jgi:hypothetical protein